MPEARQPVDKLQRPSSAANVALARALLWTLALVVAAEGGLLLVRRNSGPTILMVNSAPHLSPGRFLPEMNPAAVRIAQSFLHRNAETGWYGTPEPFIAGEALFHRWDLSLSTGLLIHNQTDFYIPDVIPINFRRTHRQLDPHSRSFGIGTTDSYELWLVGDVAPFSYIQLILADGTRIYYRRVSPGVGYTDAIYEAMPNVLLSGSRISWNGDGWNLKLRNGESLVFPACSHSSKARQCGLVAIRDSRGDVLTIRRDADGDLVEIVSPHGARLHFRHDRARRIIEAWDDNGHTVHYGYDRRGFLTTVKDIHGGVTRYTYDDAGDLRAITDPAGGKWLTARYDKNHRVAEVHPFHRAAEKLVYLTDPEGRVRGLRLTEIGRGTWDYVFDSRGYGTLLGKEQGARAEAKAGPGASL